MLKQSSTGFEIPWNFVEIPSNSVEITSVTVPRDLKSRGTKLRDFFFCQYRLSEHDLSFKHVHNHRLRHVYRLSK